MAMDDTILLARYLLARSDVVGALNVLSDYHDEKLLQYIERFWPQMFSDDAYEAIYEEAGKIEAQVEDIIDIVEGQPRYHMVRDVIEKLPSNARVLDFGCTRGAMTILLAERFGGNWTGIDIDETSIEYADVLKSRYARTTKFLTFSPDNLDFIVGDESYDFPKEYYDLILCLEVLEHVRDPISLLRKLEASVKVGGRIILSMPYGPVEYDMWVSNPTRKREHIREWLPSDMLSLFGHKKDFQLRFRSYGHCRRTGMFIGTQVVSYVADLRGLGGIDPRVRQHLSPINIHLPREDEL